MTRSILISRARAGGKARGWDERKEALARYHSKPHFCLNCKGIIVVGHRRVADVMKKKFCNSSCAASYNNINFPERYSRHGLDSQDASHVT
jgi:hypothetical protein